MTTHKSTTKKITATLPRLTTTKAPRKPTITIVHRPQYIQVKYISYPYGYINGTRYVVYGYTGVKAKDNYVTIDKVTQQRCLELVLDETYQGASYNANTSQCLAVKSTGKLTTVSEANWVTYRKVSSLHLRLLDGPTCFSLVLKLALFVLK